MIFSGYKFYNRSSGVWLPYSDRYFLPNDFTVSVSFRWEFSRKTGHILVATRPWFGSQYGWIFHVSGGDESGNIGANFNQTGTMESVGTDYRPIKINVPAHAAFTFLDGVVKVYINGKKVAEGTMSFSTVTYNTSRNLTIGNNLYYYPLMGTIRSVQIYKRALTDEEIYAIHMNEYSPVFRDLVLWHQYDLFGVRNLALVEYEKTNFRDIAEVGSFSEPTPLNTLFEIGDTRKQVELKSINLSQEVI